MSAYSTPKILYKLKTKFNFTFGPVIWGIIIVYGFGEDKDNRRGFVCELVHLPDVIMVGNHAQVS